jgi:hypothetical protein
MKLIIDTRNGIAGDIVSAGLIGLGANEKKLISEMEYAGNQIGSTEISLGIEGNARKLEISLESERNHLHESKAKEILSKLTNELAIDKFYKNIASSVLNILCEAERWVHSTDERLRKIMHLHGKGIEATLHEAKDILIDIIGLVVGLKELKISEIYYLDWVEVGGGVIRFSHGEFEVPAPATEYVLNKHNINWKRSGKEEMATPTGVSILAGCKAKRISSLKGCLIIKKSLAKGTRDLPPISFYLIK